MKTVLILFFSFAALGWSCNNSAAEAQKSPLVSIDEFKEKMRAENTVILDVRTDVEVNNGIIEGAVQLNFQDNQFSEKLKELDRSKTYLVYCASGGRSKSTQKMMFEMGFKQVYDLQGGVRAWQRDGNKLVTPR